MIDNATCPRCGVKGWEWCRTPTGALAAKLHRGRRLPADFASVEAVTFTAKRYGR